MGRWRSMPDTTRLRTAGAVLFLMACIALSVLMVLHGKDVRGFEARACQPLVGLLTTGLHSTIAVGDVVFFGLSSSDTVGLQITNECTTAVLIVPFLLIMGCVALRRSVALTRVLVATVFGVAMLIVVNVIRIGGIGWATYHWGTTTGYQVSHLVVGSLFALAGFALSVIVAIRYLVRGGNRAVD
jgi:exosortase/archaeosortase family protein